MKKSSHEYNMETLKNLIFFSKEVEIEFWLVLKYWNHQIFVNISSIEVINSSMERSSREL